LRVGEGPSEQNRAKRIPNTALEWRAANVEVKIKRIARHSDELQNLGQVIAEPQSPTTNSISCAATLLIDAVSRDARSVTIRFIGLTPVVYPADDTTNATALAHSDFRLHIEDVGCVAQKVDCERVKRCPQH
jgi:hypothetical protein